MKEELRKYQIEPSNLWAFAIFGDGYDMMPRAEKRGWEAIGGWGKAGYNLGSWPYVIIYFKDAPEGFDLAYYVEGDVTVYRAPTKDIRNQICDELAFFHWKHDECEWVENYESVDQLPDDLKGPYREEENS